MFHINKDKIDFKKEALKRERYIKRIITKNQPLIEKTLKRLEKRLLNIKDLSNLDLLKTLITYTISEYIIKTDLESTLYNYKKKVIRLALKDLKNGVNHVNLKWREGREKREKKGELTEREGRVKNNPPTKPKNPSLLYTAFIVEPPLNIDFKETYIDTTEELSLNRSIDKTRLNTGFKAYGVKILDKLDKSLDNIDRADYEQLSPTKQKKIIHRKIKTSVRTVNKDYSKFLISNTTREWIERTGDQTIKNSKKPYLKTWQSFFDDKVRPWHARMHFIQIKDHELFTVEHPYGIDYLTAPKTPPISPINDLNCRCYLSYEVL